MTDEQLKQIEGDAASLGALQAELDVFDEDVGIEVVLANADSSLLFTSGLHEAEGAGMPEGTDDPRWEKAENGPTLAQARAIVRVVTAVPEVVAEVRRLREQNLLWQAAIDAARVRGDVEGAIVDMRQGAEEVEHDPTRTP